ncbi:hypothetical protein R2E40_10160 [Aeromonas sp. CD]|uniref:hypothetical protein n=1 Tax=Aeromonas sp. CD TaxID=3080830 RepID=UPI00296602AB|nr:hypothetical protein [Aeromonas sp. CD]WOX54452.1 hypothetical protein R2E40_10160 [Aeromonas sp. CD]
MIDFTDYTTYLYGFAMIFWLYIGYDGSYERQERYKPEYRQTKKQTVWFCSLITVLVGALGASHYAVESTPDTPRQLVLLAFFYLYCISTEIAEYRGAKKLNKEEAQ